MYGPADHSLSDAATDSNWLQFELTELNNEADRRAQLTPDQAAAEQADRTANNTDTSDLAPTNDLPMEPNQTRENDELGL